MNQGLAPRHVLSEVEGFSLGVKPIDAMQYAERNMDTEKTRDERRETRHEKGFTLAEAMMATVVLSIAAAGVLLPFASGARVRAEGVRRTLAAKLASDLMEQIVNTPYNRIIDTYGSYSELQGQVKDSTGIVFTDPSYANFSRGASCAWESSQDYFILATVWVKYNGREIVNIKRLIAR